MAQFLLHGTLHATIFEADFSPDPQRAAASSRGPTSLRKTPTMLRKSFAKPASWFRSLTFLNPSQLVGSVDGTIGASPKLYATIDLDKTRLCRTRLVDEPKRPRWYEDFHLYCAHMAANVVFTIKLENPIGASVLGRAYLPIRDILNGEEVERFLELREEEGNILKRGAKMHIKIQFVDISQDSIYQWGLQDPNYPGVPHTYFPQRKGCKVSFYQDAHVPNNFIPKVPLPGVKYYAPQRCWEDIFDAISNAQHLIYIAGWSVYTKITLIRDLHRPRPGGSIALGDLLKMKASNGVRVLLLVWDDPTSVTSVNDNGLMATHDKETAEFFNGTGVHCLLCPRNPDVGDTYVQSLQVSTMFTHHQKIVVVDSDMPNKINFNDEPRRRIVSFIGGIDLCDGRYDTQFHSLFRTLSSIHRDDFHQPNFLNATILKGGPREPWHDIHCKLEGPIAWDVLFNFEQRWRKQGKKDALLQLRNLSSVIIPPSPVTFPEDEDTWNAQLFRSIDGGAVFGFPETPESAAKSGLVSGKNNIIDRSIQDAYINAIRRAKNFIYIENQYFLGSSFGWKHENIKVEDIDALHLIPKELSLKLVSKIEAGEQFAVYIVIPMWPEGVPDSASVQAILDWQRRTMEMMYKDIAQALQVKGITVNPRDYLSFFCLGNRELKKRGEYIPTEEPEPNSHYSRAQEARRFMIYVHSKMMIVDDEYIIIGSANINQRSMDGARDSEIAMGAYQPFRTSTTGKPARGQIHGFRMSLWYEHLGPQLTDTFLQPGMLECMLSVNRIADKYWDLYARDELDEDLPGHLLSYPITVTNDGRVMELPGRPFFPDTEARVLGKKSDLLPPILTT